jgi:hypothetical protein
MAETLHRKVLGAFDQYYPVPGYRRMFEALGRPGTPKQLAKRILDFLTKLREDKALPIAK